MALMPRPPLMTPSSGRRARCSRLQRTADDAINMVLQRRTGTKSLSNAQLAELYQKHLQQVASSEKITTNYITEAVNLYKNLLCDIQAT